MSSVISSHSTGTKDIVLSASSLPPVVSTAVSTHGSSCSTDFNNDEQPNKNSSFDNGKIFSTKKIVLILPIEVFDSLAFRVERLEKQYSFMMSQYCSNIKTDIIGTVVS